jgi:HEPN domain-containing protein
MCHQAIEKLFKAYYIKAKLESPPFSHSLSYLAKKGDFYELFSEPQKNLLIK